jgi:hypothetical protein
MPAGEVHAQDIDLHREIAAIIENPLYLLLDTTDGAGVRDLPVQMLESEVHMIDDTPTLTFAKSSYHLETEEAERVSVDQVILRIRVLLLPRLCASPLEAICMLFSCPSVVPRCLSFLRPPVSCVPLAS